MIEHASWYERLNCPVTRGLIHDECNKYGYAYLFGYFITITKESCGVMYHIGSVTYVREE